MTGNPESMSGFYIKAFGKSQSKGGKSSWKMYFTVPRQLAVPMR